MAAKATMIQGDSRTIEADVWQDWLTQAAKLARRFGEVEDDPFGYNEAATVSLLTAAATQADMLGLAEFISVKKNKTDLRRNAAGRCDFWMHSHRRSWAFEFKQHFYNGGMHRTETILGWLDEAFHDATVLSRKEADKRVGGLIIPIYWADHIEEAFIENIYEAAGEADFGWHLDPDSPHAGSTFILFKEVR